VSNTIAARAAQPQEKTNAFELPEVTEVQAHARQPPLRIPRRGDRVLALDLNFEWETSNEKLDLLDPALRTSAVLERRRGARARAAARRAGDPAEPAHAAPQWWQVQVPRQRQDEGLHLRPRLRAGRRAEQHRIPGCAVGKWEIETKEGGSVVLRWQVSYAGDRITDDALVKLVRHEQKQAFITLKPAATLVLVKGGKAKAPAARADDGQGDLIDEEEAEPDADEDTPERALERAHAG
jgi:hypothetical protein